MKRRMRHSTVFDDKPVACNWSWARCVHSVTRGKDAQGESTIEVECDGRVYRGRGVSTDTVEAATLAFLNAVNRAAAGGGQPIAGPRPDMV